MEETRSAEYQMLMDGIDQRLSREQLGLGLTQVADTELYRDAWVLQRGIVDRYVPAQDLYVDMTMDALGQLVPMLQIGDEEDTYMFTGTAFAQVCEKSGMGVTSYMKKCMQAGLGFLVPQNINAWLLTQGKRELLVRLYEGSVIALLSSKYGVFDHGDALDCLVDALDRFGVQAAGSKYELEAYAMTMDNLNVRLVDTEKLIVHDQGHGRDESTAGLIFRNGQTGRSVASIEFLVYTFACTNGLIVSQDRSTVYRRRHVSIDKTDFRNQILNVLEQFPAYVEESRRVMSAAREEPLTLRRVEQLRPQIQRDLAIGEDTMDSIIDMMEQRWDTNVWGLAGAITEVAQQFTAERQYQFEKYAGELMERLAA